MAQESWSLSVNGRTHQVNAAADTPLLYVDDREVRACVTPVSAVSGKTITTLEGIPGWYAKRQGLRRAPAMHPVQQALVDEQAPQCGYCMNGIVVKAAELLAGNPAPSEAQIRAAMNGHLCRCGAYPSILRAIRKVAGT
jgi:aerobic-type carbon monoxide dehydrogenase small subunit (CoxS/CutS family)